MAEHHLRSIEKWLHTMIEGTGANYPQKVPFWLLAKNKMRIVLSYSEVVALTQVLVKASHRQAILQNF